MKREKCRIFCCNNEKKMEQIFCLEMTLTNCIHQKIAAQVKLVSKMNIWWFFFWPRLGFKKHFFFAAKVTAALIEDLASRPLKATYLKRPIYQVANKKYSQIDLQTAPKLLKIEKITFCLNKPSVGPNAQELKPN